MQPEGSISPKFPSHKQPSDSEQASRSRDSEPSVMSYVRLGKRGSLKGISLGRKATALHISSQDPE